MNKFFAYVRVSTVRQGEKGVSLQEQRDAIARYAARNDVEISEWFEERETAAKRGRPVFARMLKLLRLGRARGVVIHKIDRGARNLRDWAELGDLCDEGVEIRFTEQSMDLRSRGGRLSADILAVVAADYVRNLRDEIRKGFYGRLKQGLYPLPAPLGYVDHGAGKAKTPDPATAPLVRAAFNLYASGRYSLHTLRDELTRRGLRSRRGGDVSLSALAVLLRNPFYIGLIRLRNTGELFHGAHEPLVSKATFDQVQMLLDGKTPARLVTHDFLFRRLLACATCGYSLVGERQKGRVYYRCHTAGCPPICIREDIVDQEITRVFARLQFTPEGIAELRRRAGSIASTWAVERAAQAERTKLQIVAATDRLARLTDAYLDGAVDRTLFEERKAALLLERKDGEERLAALQGDGGNLPESVSEFLELAGSLYYAYESAVTEEKRELLRIVTSNRRVTGKSVDLTLAPPFSELVTCAQITNGRPYRYTPRTSERLVDRVWAWFRENPACALLEYLTKRKQSREDGLQIAA